MRQKPPVFVRSSWCAATAILPAITRKFSVLTTFIRSRSQHERINDLFRKDAGTPLWQSTDGDEIQQQLNAKGVRFERWQADRDLGVSPTPETVIEAYQHAIDKLVAEKATRAGT